MLFYVLILMLLFLFLLEGLRESKLNSAVILGFHQNKNFKVHFIRSDMFVLLFFLFLWFLTAFRASTMGNDTQRYMNYFLSIAANGINRSARTEYGFQCLCLLISKISTDPHIFIVICATLMYGGLVNYIFRYSSNKCISLCLAFCFCFSTFMSMLRQGIAMVIVLYAYQALKTNKKILAFVLVIAASLFHYTAIFTLALFLNRFFLYKPKQVAIIAIIIAIVSATGLISNMIMLTVPKYTSYFGGVYASSGWLAVGFYAVRDAVLYVLVYQSFKNNIKENRLTLCCFMLLLFTSCFGFANNLFTRAGEYFLLIGCVEIPESMIKGQIKNRQLWTFSVCSVLLLYFLVVLILRPEWNNICPYLLWN